MSINYCTSFTRVPSGRWFCPIGEIPKNFTYCEYCINYGCIKSEDVYEATQSNNCNCDCTNRSHPILVGYTCPICLLFGTDNYDARIRFASAGYCKNCKNEISDSGETFCAYCSITLLSCRDCGKKIQDGDYYIKSLKEIIPSLNSNGELDEKMKHYENILATRTQMYEGKTISDMHNILPISEVFQIIE